eukprot:COSAG05_NODE_221_length_13654_cov_29.450103_2_plen_127_part_00
MKAAASWNATSLKYQAHPAIAFADVDCSVAPGVRAAKPAPPPGVGGWPTIRFWTSTTDEGGAGFDQAVDATGKPLYDEVCDELKSQATMEAWVLWVLAQEGEEDAELLSALHAFKTRLDAIAGELS